ncbi:hypothetical protein B0H13DRAFT_2375668 [Mycena leptocephala]|nr:hypothetical protein B0H13DRAFT_2375668 [Mycena leptocephala]
MANATSPLSLLPPPSPLRSPASPLLPPSPIASSLPTTVARVVVRLVVTAAAVELEVCHRTLFFYPSHRRFVLSLASPCHICSALFFVLFLILAPLPAPSLHRLAALSPLPIQPPSLHRVPQA